MAHIISEKLVSVATNKGNFVFPVFYIDEDIIQGVMVTVAYMGDGVSRWYPLATPRSVWASPPRVYTEFESNGHAIKGVIENGNFSIKVYDENNSQIYSGLYGVLNGDCGSLGRSFLIGTNDVPFISTINDTYSLNPSSELPVIYTANTADSFGLYSRPNYIGTVTAIPSQNDINIATAILRDSNLKITDPYANGGDSGTSEVNGDFDDTSDPIDFPSLPSLGAVDSGFITLFNPDLTELQALARYMWTNPLFDISAWKKVFADPMDAILGLSIVPVAVPDSAARPIIVGNIVTDVSMKVATQQFVEVQCGSLNVNEFWSAYLDYAPYTKAEIYLPFCGVHEISVDDIMNKTVEVRYHIDILSGACCAFVKCGESVLYQFIGQCASSIPISGNDFTNVINGVLSAATAIGSLVATGGASAPLAVPSLSATALNALKPNIEKSGAMGGTGGMLAIQKPYLVLTRPKQAHPENQNHYTGYPSFITENLGDLSGYTEIEKIHLEGVPATDAELSEIETLLKGGVIL